MPVHFALDGILLVFFLLFLLVGVRRGFIRSAAHFLGAVLSACLAGALGGLAAQWLFDSFFRGALVEKIQESISTLGAGDLAAAAQGFLSSLPDFVLRALENAGITVSSITGGLESQTGQAAEVVADALSPVFVGFLKVLAVIVLYLLFMMVVRALADLLSGVFHLPLLRQVNGLLGGVFGLLLACVSLWVVLAAVQVFLPMLAQDTQTKIQTLLDQSYLTGFLVNSNPLGFLFR